MKASHDATSRRSSDAAVTQLDPESPRPRIRSTNFVVGVCVVAVAWALLVVAARTLWGWKSGH